MAEFLMLIADDESIRDRMSQSELAAHYNRVGAYFYEHSQAGRMGTGHKLQPWKTARTIRIRGGKRVITDGPFTETKEAVGGYVMINAPDIDAAVEIAAGFPGVEGATIEVRPVYPRF
jgi:hypothetical protein